MKIVNETSVKEESYMTRWLLGPWNSQCTLDFGIAFLQPNQRVKKHIHEKVEEIFYIIKGEVFLQVNKDKNILLKQGFIAHIPPKQAHALHNTSKKIVKMVIVKSPSISSDKKYIV
ncbi:MAG: cupin domain-containing protein [Promethearchaeota archaeon]